jgi:Ca2+-binding RTX toxin-like protein
LSLATACGADKVAPTPNTGGAGGAGGTAEAGSAGKGGGSKGGSGGKGGSSTGGTASGTGGDAAAGGAPDEEPVVFDPTELDPGADAPGFDGITTTTPDFARPVTGCSAYDPKAGTLVLTLDATAPTALFRVVNGSLVVNGKACTTSDGKTQVSVAELDGVSVTGGAEDNLVVVDAASAFGEHLLGQEPAFELELGDGNDTLALLGTTESDEIRVGASGDATLLDFNADLTPDISAKGAEQVVVSTGPKPDMILCDGVDLGLEPLALPAKLYGGGANDRLLGGLGNDELVGGLGNDTLLAGRDPGGHDLFIGGEGTDFVDYAGRTAPVSVSLASGADDGEAGEADEVDASVENVRGGDGDDILVGTSASNAFFGGPGNDTITGGDGDDSMYGGDGNDQLYGEEGGDLLYGEDGDDLLVGGNGDDLLDGWPGANQLEAGDGDADICVPVDADTATGCEL